MIPILYESTETVFLNNGLGRLRSALSVRVTEERNGVYELEMTYPVDGAHFDQITPGRIIAVTHDETGDLQPFDIVGYTKPIDGIVTFHAVHISYRLTGAVTWAKNINSLTAALAVFNGISGLGFNFTADFTASGFMASFDGTPRTVRQFLGGIEGSVLDTYGGEFEWDRFNVKLHRNRGEERPFSIRYGVNLLDYQEEADWQGTYTSCVPYWTGTDGTKDVIVRGSRVDSGLTPYNGRRVVVPLDLSDKFEDKPTAAQLQSMAASLMTARQVNLPSQNIHVDFVRLQDLGEFADFQALLECRLCDTIRVIFPAYGMTGRFKIVRTVWDAIEERYTEMELGDLSTSLAEALGISETPELRNESDDLAVSGDLTVGGTITSAGKITSGGRIVLPHNTYFAAKDSGGTEQGMLFFYNGREYFGNNDFPTTIRGTSITIDGPQAGLYKVTDVAVSVAAINAHSNISATNHTMTAQSGYNAVGIVGWQTSNFRISPATNYINSNTQLYAGFKNTSASNVTGTTTVTFKVLWLKGTSG